LNEYYCTFDVCTQEPLRLINNERIDQNPQFLSQNPKSDLWLSTQSQLLYTNDLTICLYKDLQ
jgi:hypothetical protein